MMSVHPTPAQEKHPPEGGEAPAALVKGDHKPAETAAGGPSGLPDYFTRSTSRTLKAVAIIAVVLGHFFSTYGIISDTAQWGTMIFLVVSGMGLTKSYGFEPCGKRYLQRRAAKIMVPLWLTLGFFYMLDFYLLDTTYPWHEIALSFLGIHDMAPPDVPLWFITFILYLYGAFFLLSRLRVPLYVKCLLLLLTALCKTVLISRIPLLTSYIGGWTMYTFLFSPAVCLIAYRQAWLGRLQSLSDRFSPLPVVFWLGAAGLFLTLETARTPFFVALIAISIFYLDKLKSIPAFILTLGDYSYELFLIHYPPLDTYGFLLERLPWCLSLALYGLYLILFGTALKRASRTINKLAFPPDEKGSASIYSSA